MSFGTMTTATQIVTTKIGQAEHMGKHEPAVAMIRLARDLRGVLEEQGQMTTADMTAFDNILYAFLATLPAKVNEEVRHG